MLRVLGASVLQVLLIENKELQRRGPRQVSTVDLTINGRHYLQLMSFVDCVALLSGFALVQLSFRGATGSGTGTSGI